MKWSYFWVVAYSICFKRCDNLHPPPHLFQENENKKNTSFKRNNGVNFIFVTTIKFKHIMIKNTNQQRVEINYLDGSTRMQNIEKLLKQWHQALPVFWERSFRFWSFSRSSRPSLSELLSLSFPLLVSVVPSDALQNRKAEFSSAHQ